MNSLLLKVGKIVVFAIAEKIVGKVIDSVDKKVSNNK